MKLQVQHLGPIQSGEIDLSKRFYVFVGYNNSGKTYMSQLLWILFEKVLLTDFPNKTDNNATIKELINIHFPEFKNSNLDNLQLEKFNNYLSQLLKETYIPDLFNAPKEQFKQLIIKLLPISTSNNLPIETDNNVVPKILSILIEASKTFFLPANRLFYPIYYKYIYSVAKDEKDKISKAIQQGKDIETIKGFAKRPYTEMMDVLTEKIYQFNFNGNTKPTNYYADLVEKLVEVIGGKINLKSSLGIAPVEFSLELEQGQELDMHLASSSANQLTTLYLYLKYWAEEEKNFLIIDEPEENLHPKNQIKLLDILMKFANQNGNRVLMTTHSPLLTDAVNNHLHLGYLKTHNKENITKIIQDNNLNIDINAAMPHEDIGIYFFNGKTIKEYEVEEYGAFFRDFRKEEKEITRTANVLRDCIYEMNKDNKS